MSGDVFGNGMLLSRHIRLLAAFDHRHIFLDPDPDTAASFAERERLFALPRSSWDDYDRRKLSRGGGVFARTRQVDRRCRREARALLGLEAPSAAPNEIIRAILRLPVDLLWNGGIGTYVKASDRAQRARSATAPTTRVRVNGRELQAKVVGEGGNLGLSQRGRIEYALAGGRLNTDFIDNSAGVNTSDVEVNIKILLNPLVRRGQADARRPQPAAGAHDRRGGGAGAAQQLPAEPGDQHARAAGGARLPEHPASDPRAGALRRPEPRARVPAERR